jgi:hypothetical protein
MVKLPNFLRQYILRPPSDFITSRSLAAGVAETLTPPAGANCVILSATSDFAAVKNGVATVPADLADGTSSELNPIGYELYGVQTLSVISIAGGLLTAAWYS